MVIELQFTNDQWNNIVARYQDEVSKGNTEGCENIRMWFFDESGYLGDFNKNGNFCVWFQSYDEAVEFKLTWL